MPDLSFIEPFGYSHGWRDIINQVGFDVEERHPQSAIATVWESNDTLVLTIGQAVITVMGLRNPCQQINNFQQGLLKQVVHTDDDGQVVRLAGVMGIVSRSGEVSAGDRVDFELPPRPHHPLTRV